MKIEGIFWLHSTHLAVCWSLNIMPHTAWLKFRISSIAFSPLLVTYPLHHSAQWYTLTFSVPLSWKNFFFIMWFFQTWICNLFSPALKVSSIQLNQEFIWKMKYKREKDFQNFQGQMQLVLLQKYSFWMANKDSGGTAN